MAMKLEEFSSNQMQDLRRALRAIKIKVQNAEMPAELAALLQARLATSGETVYVTHRANNESMCGERADGDPVKSYTLGSNNQIFLCERAFAAFYPENPQGKPRLGSILLHELVHTCGGQELDAEAYENALFGGDGAKPPDHGDYKEFEEDGFQGVWVKMDRATGQVTDIDGRRVITFNPAFPPPRKRKRRKYKRG